MQITVYKNFSKRINSTKVPASGGITLSVVIKDYSNIETPSFTLTVSNIDQNSGFLDINYVEAFGRKYFATCNVETSTSFSIDCTLDHMATFKSNIAGYTGLVKYTSASSRVDITDPRNTPTLLMTANATQFAFNNSIFNTTGSYLIAVLGKAATGATGVCSYYSLTPTQMQAFCMELYEQDLLDKLVSQFTDSMDSLVSCVWLPISQGDINTFPAAPIKIGAQTLVSQGCLVTNRILNITTGATALAFNNYSGGAGNDMTYLEKAPYCTGEIYLPFVGYVPIDMDFASYTKNITVSATIDVLTGDICYKVQYGAYWVSTYSGNIATKMPVSGAGYDAVGIASGVLTAIGGVAATIATVATGGSAGAVMGALGATVGGGAMAVKSAEFHTMINGSNSSAIAANIAVNPFAMIYQYIPAETDLLAYQTEQGMPYFKTATLSSLSGYIQCADASVSIPGNGSEQSVVNGFLNSGFYLE